MNGRVLTQSETRHASLYRPEQLILVDFLGKFNVQAEAEKEIQIDGMYHCELHGDFESNFLNSKILQPCPSCKILASYKKYLLDVFLPEKNIEIAINGKIHDRKGIQRKDSRRKAYLESKGIISIPFPSSMFLDTRNRPRYDTIESFAHLIAILLGASE